MTDEYGLYLYQFCWKDKPLDKNNGKNTTIALDHERAFERFLFLLKNKTLQNKESQNKFDIYLQFYIKS